MEVAKEGGAESFRWKYSLPHNAIPGLKGSMPHSVWAAEMGPVTWVPKRDSAGKYIVKKTGGILGTMMMKCPKSLS